MSAACGQVLGRWAISVELVMELQQMAFGLTRTVLAMSGLYPIRPMWMAMDQRQLSIRV